MKATKEGDPGPEAHNMQSCLLTLGKAEEKQPASVRSERLSCYFLGSLFLGTPGMAMIGRDTHPGEQVS